MNITIIIINLFVICPKQNILYFYTQSRDINGILDTIYIYVNTSMWHKIFNYSSNGHRKLMYHSFRTWNEYNWRLRLLYHIIHIQKHVVPLNSCTGPFSVPVALTPTFYCQLALLKYTLAHNLYIFANLFMIFCIL